MANTSILNRAEKLAIANYAIDHGLRPLTAKEHFRIFGESPRAFDGKLTRDSKNQLTLIEVYLGTAGPKELEKGHLNAGKVRKWLLDAYRLCFAEHLNPSVGKIPQINRILLVKDITIENFIKKNTEYARLADLSGLAVHVARLDEPTTLEVNSILLTCSQENMLFEQCELKRPPPE